MSDPRQRGNATNAHLQQSRREQAADPIAMFLTPESMLTPGVVGALVMMITNALANNFHISRPYTGLFLSMVCGLLVLVTENSFWKKGIYYVLNSLVIFCVAVGSGTVATSDQRASLSSGFITIARAAEKGEGEPHTFYTECVKKTLEALKSSNQTIDNDKIKMVNALCGINDTINESNKSSKTSPWDTQSLVSGTLQGGR